MRIAVLGAGVMGAQIADLLSGDALRNIVGFGALAIAAQMALVTPKPVAPDARPPSRLELGLAGTVIGAAAALIGIGGGSLNVPYLNLRGVPIHQAVGTSAAASPAVSSRSKPMPRSAAIAPRPISVAAGSGCGAAVDSSHSASGVRDNHRPASAPRARATA